MWAVLAETVQQILETEAELSTEFVVDDRKHEQFRVEQPAGHTEQDGLPVAIGVDRVATNAQVVLDVEREDPLGDNVETVQNEMGE